MPTDLDQFEDENPHEKLNDVTRDFSTLIESLLISGKHDPAVDVAKRIRHRISGFAQSLEFIIGKETNNGQDKD